MNQTNPPNIILLTIDVEDWFQVENFRQCIPYSCWSECELRVEKNTALLLDLFERFGVKTTFFVLGWIAECLPNLVREIESCGHEVASHGYYHNLCNQGLPDDLKKDLSDSKKLLEDITGLPVYGYRAPSFSVNPDILGIIETCGYLYDSSFNSFTMHNRYGRVNLSNHGKNGIATKISDSFYELPISNLKWGNHIFPWGGGGYFRLTPFPLFKLGVQSILRREKAYVFYLHPWEIDPKQPKVKEASIFFRFRHYASVAKTLSKLSSFLQHFEECGFYTCYRYLKSRENQLTESKEEPLVSKIGKVRG
jgi:polysaccharide deacetylase family protein (PEP-CTERM system associated)